MYGNYKPLTLFGHVHSLMARADNAVRQNSECIGKLICVQLSLTKVQRYYEYCKATTGQKRIIPHQT